MEIDLNWYVFNDGGDGNEYIVADGETKKKRTREGQRRGNWGRKGRGGTNGGMHDILYLCIAGAREICKPNNILNSELIQMNEYAHSSDKRTRHTSVTLSKQFKRLVCLIHDIEFTPFVFFTLSPFFSLSQSHLVSPFPFFHRSNRFKTQNYWNRFPIGEMNSSNNSLFSPSFSKNFHDALHSACFGIWIWYHSICYIETISNMFANAMKIESDGWKIDHRTINETSKNMLEKRCFPLQSMLESRYNSLYLVKNTASSKCHTVSE